LISAALACARNLSPLRVRAFNGTVDTVKIKTTKMVVNRLQISILDSFHGGR
jgi:hypothetical protein